MSREPKADAKLFLNALFARKEPSHFVNVWSRPEAEGGGKYSRWYSDLSQSFAALDELVDKPLHVYAGVGLSGQSFGPQRRCSSKDVVAVVGLWLDIDIAGPGHKKENLPDDRDSARRLIYGASPFKPTLIVDSGGGFHFYWLFPKPYKIETEENRHFIAHLIERWQSFMRAQTLKAGWTIDATHDLARIMRVAGTRNVKEGGDRRSSIVFYEKDLRPDPLAIAEWIAEKPSEAFAEKSKARDRGDTLFSSDSAKVTQGGLTYDPKASIDLDRLDGLFDAFPQAKSTFYRKRRDLHSPSEHDYSLMSFARQAHWTDQEIVDLVIHFRRKNYGKGSPEHQKAYKRRDYVVGSLVKLAEANGDEKRFVKLAPTEATDAIESGDMKLIADGLRSELGVPFRAFHRYGDTNAIWEVEMIDGRRGKLGPTKDLLKTKQTLDIALLEAVGDVSSWDGKLKDWPLVVKRIARIAIKHKAEELNPVSRLVDAISDFLADGLDESDRPVRTLVAQEATFIAASKLFVRGTKLKDYLSRRDREIAEELAFLMRKLGFRVKRENFRKSKKSKGSESSRSYWTIHIDDLPERLRLQLLEEAESVDLEREEALEDD